MSHHRGIFASSITSFLRERQLLEIRNIGYMYLIVASTVVKTNSTFMPVLAEYVGSNFYRENEIVHTKSAASGLLTLLAAISSIVSAYVTSEK